MQPGRKYSSGSQYRYGFNGHEKDKEVNENITTALYWEYDSRIGRRWDIDPIIKMNASNYCVLGNNPISMIDPDGADWYENNKTHNAKYFKGGREHKGFTKRGGDDHVFQGSTLDAVSVVGKMKKKSIQIESVIQTKVRTSCHVTNQEVNLAQSVWWYNATKDLDVSNGQVMPPRSAILNYIAGNRTTEDPQYISPLTNWGGKKEPKYTNTAIVNADGYIVGHELFRKIQGDAVFTPGMRGGPVLRLFTCSKNVMRAEQALAAGKLEIGLEYGLTQTEVEELFLRNYVTKGYSNVTEFSSFEMKDKFMFPKGKLGTYHWDLFDTMHGGVPHLQVHDDVGNILRIFFKK